MKIEALNCPNCGGHVHIAPGMRYLYCEYCGSSLAVQPDGEQAGSSAPVCQPEQGDNPLYIKLVPVEEEPMQLYLSNDAFLSLVCLCYYLRMAAPQTFEQPVEEMQRKPRRFHSLRAWGETEESTRGWSLYQGKRVGILDSNEYSETNFRLSELLSKLDIEREITSSFSAWRPGRDQDNCLTQFRDRTDTIRLRLDPRTAERSPELLRVLKSCQENQRVRAMIMAVADQALAGSGELQLGVDRFRRREGAVLTELGIRLTVGRMPTYEELHPIVARKPAEPAPQYIYWYQSYSLENPRTPYHAHAMLAAVVAEIIQRSGGRWALRSVGQRSSYEIGEYVGPKSIFEHDVVLYDREYKKPVKVYEAW